MKQNAIITPWCFCQDSTWTIAFRFDCFSRNAKNFTADAVYSSQSGVGPDLDLFLWTNYGRMHLRWTLVLRPRLHYFIPNMVFMPSWCMSCFVLLTCLHCVGFSFYIIKNSVHWRSYCMQLT